MEAFEAVMFMCVWLLLVSVCADITGWIALLLFISGTIVLSALAAYEDMREKRKRDEMRALKQRIKYLESRIAALEHERYIADLVANLVYKEEEPNG